MNAWPWLAALLLYAVFAVWYHNWRGPLAPEEVERYLRRWAELPDPPSSEVFDSARRFLESDSVWVALLLGMAAALCQLVLRAR